MNEQFLGLLFAVGSIIGWGSFGLPLKKYKVTDINPIVLQFYFSIAIFLSSWLILLYNEFRFTYLGVVGAAVWVNCSILSFLAIKMAGLAIAQGTWSGFVIIVSFLWGAVYFREPITSLPFVLVGLLLIFIGIILISFCNTQFRSSLPTSIQFVYEWNWLFTRVEYQPPRNHEKYEILTDDDDHKVDHHHQTMMGENTPLLAIDKSDDSNVHFESNNEEVENRFNSILQNHQFVIGMTFAVILGIASGCLFVPMQYLPADFKGDNSIIYVVSFAIGSMAISSFYFIIYVIYLFAFQNRQLPDTDVKKNLTAALVGGLLWSIGNFCGTYAVIYLGIAIGFPLTQASIVVAGLWGIFLLREITRIAAIVQFFVGSAVLLAGCALLAAFS